ncbi:hypothetical protein GCM10027578_28460 [Spirosoma luteolum]
MDGLPPAGLLSSLVTLLASVFTNQTPESIADDLHAHQAYPAFRTELALLGEVVVGCKLGYESEPDRFYSWLGCVRTDCRGQGIAATLMTQQHDWCQQQGYRSIRTQTYNQWRSMLLLNIRAGFDIVGTEPGRYGLKIVLEKTLWPLAGRRNDLPHSG